MHKESVIKPYAGLQLFSNSLLAIFGILLAWGLLSEWGRSIWGGVLLHGLEGGLVGAVCDWFAVWKTYRAVEIESETIAEEIGKWVSSDLVNEVKLKEYMDRILDDPDNISALSRLIETHLGGEQEVRKLLDLIWDKVEEDIVRYLTNFRFSGSDQEILRELNRRKEIFGTVRFLVGEALVKATDQADFKMRMDRITKNLSFFAKPLVWLIDPQKRIREFGEGLKDGKEFDSDEEGILYEVFSLFSDCADLYIGSWNDLPESTKEEAVRALTDFGKDQLNRLVTDVILLHMEDIKKLGNLREYGPARSILEFLRSRTNAGVSQYVGEQVALGLKLLEPRQFRINLEEKTRKVLEKIRINGSLLGFVCGIAIGLADFLF
ncbi:membrane protein [Leptospira broomii]